PCLAASGTLNTVALTQPSKDAFNFTYNLGNGASNATNDFRRYGGALLSFGKDASGVDITRDLTSGLVLGLSSDNTAVTKLLIDVVDVADRKVTVSVSGLTSANQNYQI